MPRGSPTYGFNCGVIAKANNKTVGNVQHHLQFNFFLNFLKIIIEILSPGNISVQCEKVKETTESLSKMTLRKRYMT